MKSRTYLALASAVLLSSVAIPALAEVDILVNVDKTKTITVTETVTKTKDFLVDVTTLHELEGAAEAMALANVDNTDNIVDQSPTAPQGLFSFGWEKDALIEDSINDNTGIVGVNQSVGNMANQGNVAAIAVIGDFDSSALAFTNTQAFADQENTGNSVHHEELLQTDPPGGDPLVDPLDPNLTATIGSNGLGLGSINNNSGVVGVNQDAGSMNNQHNLLALAVAFNAVVALSESGLGQVNSGNEVNEIETVKSADISNSISSNSGIVGVNQAVGNMNNQASVVSFSAMTSTAAITIPGG